MTHTCTGDKQHPCDCSIGRNHSDSQHRAAMSVAYASLTFTLTITLGNEGMQTGGDIQDALHALDHNYPSLGKLTPGNVAGGTIRDVNGNTVGSWAIQ